MAWGEEGSVTIAILKDGDSPFFRDSVRKLKAELSTLFGPELQPVILDGEEWEADWDVERAGTVLQAALQDPRVDIVCANGMAFAQAVLTYGQPFAKPVVLGLLLYPPGLDLPITSDGCSPISNLTYVVASGGIGSDLQVFHDLIGFRQLTILADQYVLDSEFVLGSAAQAFAREKDLKLALAPIARTAEETLATLPDETEAIYLVPSAVMNDAEMEKLIAALTGRRLPTFSGLGKADVQRGALAGQRGDQSDRLIRRLALNLHQISRGVAAHTLPVKVEHPSRLVLNGRTMRELGIDLPYSLMFNADVLYSDEIDRGQPIDLATAMDRALTGNPALAAGRESVASAWEERNVARSALLPQLGAQLQYNEIDEDRARGAMGLQPQRATLGGVSLAQVIFNDPAITAFRAQSLAWKSRQFEQDAREMDTLEAVGQAYFQLLSQRAMLQIELGNLEQIQRYLDMAADRERAGVATAEETFRWKAQLAAARASATEAYAQVAQAQALLNEVMGEDVEKQWDPVDCEGLIGKNPLLDPAFADTIQNDREFKALWLFLLEKARENAPELKALDLAIRAQQLMVNQYARRSLVPEVGVLVNFDHTIDSTMAEPAIFTNEEEDTWMVALAARWSLFEGGRAAASARQTRAEIRRLKALRQQVEQALSRRLYNALSSASSAQTAIQHAQEAVTLARRNLEGVQKRYAIGKTTIVDLLDAQTEVFVQERRVALAKYQYLSSVVQVERAIAWFPEQDDIESRARWMSEWENRRGAVGKESP